MRKEVILEDSYRSKVTRKVNALLSRRNGLTTKDIAGILNYSPRMVRYALKRLEDDGVVKQFKDIAVDTRITRYYLIRGN